MGKLMIPTSLVLGSALVVMVLYFNRIVAVELPMGYVGIVTVTGPVDSARGFRDGFCETFKSDAKGKVEVPTAHHLDPLMLSFNFADGTELTETKDWRRVSTSETTWSYYVGSVANYDVWKQNNK